MSLYICTGVNSPLSVSSLSQDLSTDGMLLGSSAFSPECDGSKVSCQKIVVSHMSLDKRKVIILKGMVLLYYSSSIFSLLWCEM